MAAFSKYFAWETGGFSWETRKVSDNLPRKSGQIFVGSTKLKRVTMEVLRCFVKLEVQSTTVFLQLLRKDPLEMLNGSQTSIRQIVA